MKNQKTDKNPMLAGFFNIVVPGSSHLYANKDWGMFSLTFVLGAVAWVAALWGGNLIQNSRGYALPQGVCMGVLLMTVIVVLFLSGHRTATERNLEVNTAAFYNSKRTILHGSKATQYAEIQKMRDEGLISEEEFEEKNAKVVANP